MRKSFLLSIALFIQWNVVLSGQSGEILPDGIRTLRPLYQDQTQEFFEVRIMPPGSPRDYDFKTYFDRVQFRIYRLNKEKHLYTDFVPYKLIANIPRIRTQELDSQPLQCGLFQDKNDLILIELNYEKGAWKSLMKLPREFDNTPRMTWDIQYTTNPNLFVYSRAISNEEYGHYSSFELGVIDVNLDKVQVLVPQVFRKNSPTSSMSPSTPLVVYRDEYVFYPITKGPMRRGNFSTIEDYYDSLVMQPLNKGEAIEVATHDLMISCELSIKGGELRFYDRNLGNVEDIVKRVRAKGEE